MDKSGEKVATKGAMKFGLKTLIKGLPILGTYLDYENNYKFIFIILIVLLTFVSYIGFSIIIKAFKISDINLKY